MSFYFLSLHVRLADILYKMWLGVSLKYKNNVWNSFERDCIKAKWLMKLTLPKLFDDIYTLMKIGTHIYKKATLSFLYQQFICK